MRILLLDGDNSHTLSIASELQRELGAEIVGVGTSSMSALLRSRYCSVKTTAPHASTPEFRTRLLDIVAEHSPDLIIPVGFRSYTAVIEIREQLQQVTRTTASVAKASFELASDKSATYELAKALGVSVPSDLTDEYTSALVREDYSALRFPVFLKAQLEAGGVTTALVHSLEELRTNLSRMRDDLGTTLVQDFIDTGPETYAHCGYYQKGTPILTFQHVEVRSVPRWGGSGTRVRTYQDHELAALAESLLKELEWDGVAQVEFKRGTAGEYVLMEINPKFWASYALASRAGYLIATVAASSALNNPIQHLLDRPKRQLDMVFPIRELTHVFKNRGRESIMRATKAMLWPPAQTNIDLRDFVAYLPSRLSRTLTRSRQR